MAALCKPAGVGGAAPREAVVRQIKDRKAALMKSLPDSRTPSISRRSFLGAAATAGFLAAGPFVTAAAAKFPTGAEIVRTSGYSAAGRGDALYVHEAAVNLAYVAANPRSSFVSDDGSHSSSHAPRPPQRNL